MRVLVLGGNGKTGKRVIRRLLDQNINSRILLRKPSALPDELRNNHLLEIVIGSISEMNRKNIADLVLGCDVTISCLGHNISFKGLFGKPRNLVYKAIKDVCEGIKRNNTLQTKFILMSTTAFTNHMIGEKNKIIEKIIFLLFYFLLPPHKDNINAANYFVKTIGTEDSNIKWVIVRPDNLIELDTVTSYKLEIKRNRSPIFNPGKTIRINVSNFIVDLISDENLWNSWEFRAPVIYNQ